MRTGTTVLDFLVFSVSWGKIVIEMVLLLKFTDLKVCECGCGRVFVTLFQE